MALKTPPASPSLAPSTWFTSDLHLGDHQVLGYGTRPFKTVKEMNRVLCNNWAETVGELDDIWILGDLARGSRLDAMLAMVAKLPGNKHLVLGNHDRCWPYRDSYSPLEVERYAAGGFVSITVEQDVSIAGHDVKLSHFPYATGDRATGLRHTVKPIDEGGWLVHGHIHRAWLQKQRQICVAVDAWRFRPVHLSTLELLIGAGPNNIPALAPAQDEPAPVGVD